MTLRNIGRGDLDGLRNLRRFNRQPLQPGDLITHFGREEEYDTGLKWLGALCSDKPTPGRISNEFFRVNCPTCVRAAELLYVHQALRFHHGGSAQGGPTDALPLNILRWSARAMGQPKP